jgi:elongation factor P
VISAGELKKGIAIELDGELFNIVDYEHIKVGRGGAVVRLKLRNLRSGYNAERTFSATERFRRVYLDHRQAQYLYRDEDTLHFMDTETYDQMTMNIDQLGSDLNYLKENMVVDLLKFGDETIGVELPVTVDLEVTYTEPGFKGDTATGGNKPATLETGLKVMVPLFLEIGDVIRVDTRTGNYLERVKK